MYFSLLDIKQATLICWTNIFIGRTLVISDQVLVGNSVYLTFT
jgi:hypothetical protein